MLTVIEKVIFLQKVDDFSEIPAEQLAYLSAIAEETNFQADTTIYSENDPSDALYLVLEGGVRLHRSDTEIAVANSGETFGTWALFDDEPRLVSATTIDNSKLLRIDREDFVELLADNVHITQGILRKMARRLRGLITRVDVDAGAGSAGR